MSNITFENLGAEELFNALRGSGVNTLDEFEDAIRGHEASISDAVRLEVAEMFTNLENEDWEEAKRLNTEEAYQKYLDSYPEGEYREEAREAIDNLQSVVEVPAVTDTWDDIDKTSLEEVQSFVDENPSSPHFAEANSLLKELRKEQYLGVDIRALARQIKAIRTDARINNPEKAIYDRIVKYISTGKISIDDLLNAIAEDNNFISGTVANLLWENGIIKDFTKAGIDADFIAHMMSNILPQKFQAPEPITRITKTPCTEVYFWGIPSSGKSCALGAILSSANSGKVARSMQRDPNCQGYGYMTRLANLFKTNGAVGTLPEGTAISSTYEMGFVLEDEDGTEHPITCVDLAGELVRCMYKQDAGEPLTDEQQNVLRTLTNVLIDNRTDNRKIHFFVIEYGAEDREYEGLPQKDYLEAVVAYIQRTGIFKNDTDGIYLLISKVDKAKAVGKELQEKLRAYILENYRGFYNGLKKVCKDNEINGGEVEIQPFTLGTVCFQNYCKFKEDTAATVVRTLMKRSYGQKPGKVNSFFSIFKR